MKILISIFLLLIAVCGFSQKVTISGEIRDSLTQAPLPYVNVVIRQQTDSAFVTGAISNEEGIFQLLNATPGDYFIDVSLIGYKKMSLPVVAGSLSEYLDLGKIYIAEDNKLGEVEITATQDAVSGKMDKKTFSVEEAVSQSGGTALDFLKTLPGISVTADGKIQLRGSENVVILIDGKQTALTGLGGQAALENIPASAIERVEIINNPSSKYDANGSGGIINIILKKESAEGFNGKVGLSGGAGALWIKQENLPTIRPQYQVTPKINPSVSLNYRKKNYNLFFQGDYLYTHTLNKNEFVERIYDNGDTILQQTKRNRNTGVATARAGIDYTFDEHNSFTFSTLFSSEKIIDNGDEPFFNGDLSERLRLWQFLEDELKTTVTASLQYQHKFKQPGRLLNVGFNYTFHRENEKYFFTNVMPTFTGYDSFKLLSDEQVGDFNFDYLRPLKYGRFETGVKLRKRFIPTNMQFFPGINSPLDTNAGGWANYNEIIPAAYATYAFENNRIEIEAGVRVEYVKIDYKVNPDHSTYQSSGYDYIQPFPNARLTVKLNDHNRISVFYNRRVDRPNEVDIRIFPKYDDAEIIKVGNPALRPQFTNSFEIGYKTAWGKGYFYSAVYQKMMDATITRISVVAPNSHLIYAVFQNAGRSSISGVEMMFSQKIGKVVTLNFNANGYQNTINAFTVVNLYPARDTFSAPRQQIISGNLKLNGVFHFPKKLDAQVSAVYLAPDLIPQGKIGARFSLDIGVKKTIQDGKGEVFVNATDIANTMNIKRTIQGDGFSFTAIDYYETQVVRIGYSYRF